MRAEVWSELEVDLPADEIWAVYGSPDLPRLILTLLPTFYESVLVVEGDGTEGTILEIVVKPGNRGPRTWHEKFTKIDQKQRVKVVAQLVGGYLDDEYGFNSYAETFTITPKGCNSCVIRQASSFDVKEGSEAKASFITADWSMAQAVEKYVKACRATATAKA